MALRPEPFGALVYHFGNRKLSFLKSKTLVTVVEALGEHPSADGHPHRLRRDRGPAPRVRQALADLARSQMIEPRATVQEDDVTAVLPDRGPVGGRLIDQFEYGLDAPICLTWELTYACNLACVHCLSSSGRRDPRELSTAEAERVIDELQRMQVFYVNVGGGEPTVRPDFWHLLDYAIGHDVGVKFSTNGVKLDRARAEQLARTDYVDVQISLDGATAEVNDRVRGAGSFATATRALENLAEAGMKDFKVSVVVTRENVGQLDEFKALTDSLRRTAADHPAAPLGPRRRRLGPAAPHPGSSSASSTPGCSPTARRCSPATRSSTCPPSARRCPGLNLCGAGRVVCLIDPVGDVYACPFAIHENFLAGNVRDEGGFQRVWQSSELFADLRSPQTGGACTKCAHFDACRGGCMAAKFFTGLPLDGPDPECVQGYGETALAARDLEAGTPRSHLDHSHTGPVRGQPTLLGMPSLPRRAALPPGPATSPRWPDSDLPEPPLRGGAHARSSRNHPIGPMVGP